VKDVHVFVKEVIAFLKEERYTYIVFKPGKTKDKLKQPRKFIDY
jgi:hypothetical protein